MTSIFDDATTIESESVQLESLELLRKNSEQAHSLLVSTNCDYIKKIQTFYQKEIAEPSFGKKEFEKQQNALLNLRNKYFKRKERLMSISTSDSLTFTCKSKLLDTIRQKIEYDKEVFQKILLLYKIIDPLYNLKREQLLKMLQYDELFWIIT